MLLQRFDCGHCVERLQALVVENHLARDDRFSNGRLALTVRLICRRNLLQIVAVTATPVTAQTVFNLYGARHAQILPVYMLHL